MTRTRAYSAAGVACPKHHAKMPFWACTRFSASSNTIDCGPSITSSVTSSPRCAGRQCMNTALGFGHEGDIHLVGLEQIVPALAIPVAHRNPGVRHYAVRTFHRFFRIAADADRGAGTFDPVDQRFLRSELSRCGDPQMELESLGRMHPGHEHIIGCAAPSHGLTADEAAVLLEGHHVRKHLARVRLTREPVDHRHRSVARGPDHPSRGGRPDEGGGY